MNVNLPYGSLAFVQSRLKGGAAHDHTILPDLNVVANRRSLDNRIGPNVNVVPNLHRVIVEVSAVSLIGRPFMDHLRLYHALGGGRQEGHGSPHDAALADEAVAAE